MNLEVPVYKEVYGELLQAGTSEVQSVHHECKATTSVFAELEVREGELELEVQMLVDDVEKVFIFGKQIAVRAVETTPAKVVFDPRKTTFKAMTQEYDH